MDLTFLEKIKQYFSKPDLVILRQGGGVIIARIGAYLISVSGLNNIYITVNPPPKLDTGKMWLSKEYPKYYHILVRATLLKEKLKERYKYGEM